VPSGDVEALTVAMQTLIADEGLRERMGKRGLELAENFSADQVLPGFERLYEEVAALAVDSQ
jgi:glycosyltransferase involved in cell wall biosynthesis